MWIVDSLILEIIKTVGWLINSVNICAICEQLPEPIFMQTKKGTISVNICAICEQLQNPYSCRQKGQYLISVNICAICEQLEQLAEPYIHAVKKGRYL